MARDRTVDRWPLAEPDWPAGDRQAWAGLFAATGLFAEDGAAAGWAEATQIKNGAGYGHWLGYLHREGRLDAAAAPADRVTPAAVRDYVEHLRARGMKPVGVFGRVVELACVVKKMARDRCWAWLDRLIARLRAVSVLRRDHVGLPAASALLALGRRLIDGSPAVADPLAQAIAYRDGLLIAFLAARPVRMRNLVMMRLGRHLVPTGTGWRLAFAAEETKYRRPLAMTVPEGLVAAIATYLDRHRPVLLAGTGRWRRRTPEGAGDAVWVSRDGTKMTADGIAGRIHALTRRHLGRAVSPHAFRAAAASEIAERDPLNVRVAAGLLGHSSFAVTEAHYVQVSGVTAGTRYHAGLARLRRNLPPPDRS